MLWGVTEGVSFCRFEELFAPITGVRVVNVSAEQLVEVAIRARTDNYVRVGNYPFRVFRSGERAEGNFFSWDLAGSKALAAMTPVRPPLIVARPSAAVGAQAQQYAVRNGVTSRLGIRVRVEEYLSRDRKPHRIKHELDAALRPLLRIPWYTKVFVATDSEYIQQMLASHFIDTIYLPKRFDLEESSGKYVQRTDKNGMVTFLKEVDCLCRCARIINIGGFLNDRSVGYKMMKTPYAEAALLHLKSTVGIKSAKTRHTARARLH